MDGIKALLKETQIISLLSLPPYEDIAKRRPSVKKEVHSLDMKSAGTLFLDVPASRTMRNIRQLPGSHPVYTILL